MIKVGQYYIDTSGLWDDIIRIEVVMKDLVTIKIIDDPWMGWGSVEMTTITKHYLKQDYRILRGYNTALWRVLNE